MRCQKPVRCWDMLIRPCRLPAGHSNGCNPFSSTPAIINKLVEKHDDKQKQPQPATA